MDREDSEANISLLKIAELVKSIKAMKKVLLFLLNIIICKNMLISKPLLQVRYRQKKIFPLESEIYSIFENSTALTCFFLNFGPKYHRFYTSRINDRIVY